MRSEFQNSLLQQAIQRSLYQVDGLCRDEFHLSEKYCFRLLRPPLHQIQGQQLLGHQNDIEGHLQVCHINFQSPGATPYQQLYLKRVKIHLQKVYPKEFPLE